jgi:hypothetical protein
MGFLSSAWKSVSNAFKKVFKPIMKPFAKLMDNKFFKGAMLAVSVFTAGASLLAAGASGGMKGIGNLILKKATEIITMPIDLVAGGIGKVGGTMGGSLGGSLQSFAQSVQGGLSGVKDFAGSVFGEASSLTAGTNTDMIKGAVDAVAGSAGDGITGTMDSEIRGPRFDARAIAENNVGPQIDKPSLGFGSEPAGGAPMGLPPNEVAMTPPPGTPTGVSRIAEFAKKTTDPESTGGFFSKASDFVSKTVSHIQDNKDAYKMGFDALAGMTEEDEATTLARAKNEVWNHRNTAFQPYAEQGFGGQVPGNYSTLKSRTAGFMTAATNASAEMGRRYGTPAAMYGGTT